MRPNGRCRPYGRPDRPNGRSSHALQTSQTTKTTFRKKTGLRRLNLRSVAPGCRNEVREQGDDRTRQHEEQEGAGLGERPRGLGVEAIVKEALGGGGTVEGPGFKLGLLRDFGSRV